MKKFKFRLQSLEKHRKMQEQDRRIQLAKSLERLRATEAKLLELDRKEVEARKEFAALGELGGENKAVLANFWMLDQFIQGQKYRRSDLKLRLQDDEQQVGFAYAEFLKARQQKKIMEKLRENDEAHYVEEVRRHELHGMDEQYTMRFRLSKEAAVEEEREDLEDEA